MVFVFFVLVSMASKLSVVPEALERERARETPKCRGIDSYAGRSLAETGSPQEADGRDQDRGQDARLEKRKKLH